MNRQNLRNPRHRSKYKKQPMEESASECHTRPRAEQRKEQNPYANPRIDTQIETGEGERKPGPRYRANHKTQTRWRFHAGLRVKVGEPAAHGHQCFTMALKPEPSRPFLAASAAF